MARRVRKTTLCSTLAIATSMLFIAKPAAAQFIGTVTYEQGAHAHTLGNGQMVVNVTSPQAVLNWSATGAPGNGLVTFQQAGAVVTYQGNSTFAVLNRITPVSAGNAIYMNGQILTSVNGQTGGGTVFFYSPNGIVIGQNAVINVGSLGLTTSPIADDGNGNWLTGMGTAVKSIQFGNSLSSGYVRLDPGSQVTAAGIGNFVAVLAPRVDHLGTIRTDGTAALIGAEAATLTIRDSGLWDIVVDTGTSDSHGVNLAGTITRATAAVGYNHQAYIVAVPKNDAVTMLFGPATNLGFEIAGSVGVENNVVVLSAGNDVVNGQIIEGAPGNSSIGISGGTYSSHLRAGATGLIDVNSDGGAVNFARNATLTGNTVVMRATGNNITVGGNLTMNASRQGGLGEDVTAGDVTVQALNGKTLQVMGYTGLTAIGTGGDAADDGLSAGRGEGGHILIQAASGGTLRLDGGVTADASGRGGLQWGIGGSGGEGQGGTILMLANDGNSKVIAGSWSELEANGEGGTYGECSACGVAGGDGHGGTIAVNGAGGAGNSLTLGTLLANASGVGGDGDAGGGDGHGGSVGIGSADGAILTLSGPLYQFADGGGGNGVGNANGGAGYGGIVTLGGFGSAGGSITINGTADSFVTAEAFGGSGGASGGNGGFAQGGESYVNTSGAALTVGKTLWVRSDARGGSSPTGRGGDALAGTAFVDVNSNHAMTLGARLVLHSYAIGGQGLTGGGHGTGQGSGLTVNAGSFSSVGNVEIESYGTGGIATGVGGVGGNGTGGHGSIAYWGGALNIGGTAFLRGYGTGGNANNGIGGTGTGGDSSINVNGGAVTFLAASLDAKGTGGSGSSAGGSGVGGWSRIYGTAGSATFATPVTVNASGTGGLATNGAGGLGAGGRARVNSDGAAFHFNSDLTLDSRSVGGAGRTGGNAIAGVFGQDYSTFVRASGGGQVNVSGATLVTTTATGGNGSAGNGGAATAGSGAVLVHGNALGSSVNLNDVTIDASAYGGSGGAGGHGGNASGGPVLANTINSVTGTNALNFDQMTLQANAYGGMGGAGTGGATGGAGGNGGTGLGGTIQVAPTSGSGALTGNTIYFHAIGSGGAGGAGGAGTAGVGGSGGSGGTGTGGYTSIGLVSGVDTPSTNGSFTLGLLAGYNDSRGGNGGNGGAGTAGAGAGGNGGNALTSHQQILQRGGTMTIGSVSMPVDSVAGNGGTGSTAGIGGTAYTSNIFLTATHRFQRPEATATLSIGSFYAYSAAHRGTGSVNGQQIAYGGHQLWTDGAAIDLGSYSVDIIAGDGIHPNSYADPIQILNSTVNVDGAFVVHTDNRMSVVLDNGELNAGSVSLDAADFEYDLTYSPADDRGTISAGSIGISSGKDIILDAQLVSGGGLSLNASNMIDLGDLTAAGDIDVSAGSTVQLGDLSSGGSSYIAAGGAIDAGSITSGGYLDVYSSGGPITLQTLSAFGSINLEADGALTFGDATSSDGEVDLDATGAILGGNIVAAGSILGGSDSSITLGNLSAGYSEDDFGVGIAAAGPILVGNVTTSDSVGFASLGSLTTGNISAGEDILLLSGQDIATGSLTAADRIFMAHSSMFLDNGGAEDEFDPEAVFAAVPVATPGSISIGGPIAAGSFQAAAGTQFSAGTIDVDGLLYVEAGQSIAVGNVSSGLSVDFTAGDLEVDTEGSILIGDVTSDGAIRFSAAGSVTGGDFTAAGDLSVSANDGVTLDALSSGGDITLWSNAAVQTNAIGASGLVAITSTEASVGIGDIDAGGSVGVDAATTLVAGDILAGGGVTLVAGGAITAGDILAGAAPVFSLTTLEVPPVDIAINSGGALSLGDLEASNHVLLAAAGTLQAGSLIAGDAAVVLGDGTIALGPVDSGGLFYVGGTAIMASAGEIGSTFSLGALDLGQTNASGGTATIGGTIHAGEVSSYSAGNFSSGDIQSYGATFIGSHEGIATGSIHSGDGVNLVAGGSLSAGTVNAGQAISLSAGTTLNASHLTAGSSVTLAAGGAINVGNILANQALFDLFGSEDGIGLLNHGEGVEITSEESVTTGSITTEDGIVIDAGTTIATGALSAGTIVDLTAGTGITVGGTTNAGSYVQMESASGPIQLGAVRADGDVDLETAGTIAGSTISAGGSVGAWGGQGVTLTNVDAGIVGPLSESVHEIGIGSTGNVSLGTINGAGDVGMAAGGNLLVGNIAAQGDVLAMVGGNSTFGSINTAHAGRFAVAGYGMFAIGGGADDFDKAPVFTAVDNGSASATGGSIQIQGPVSADQVDLLAGGNLSTGAIDAYAIAARSGGLATINGQWMADTIALTSNDISIGSNGSMSGWAIDLTSTNANQMAIGGGLTTTAYLLDAAEFSRISAAYLTLTGRSDASAAIDMVIGNLSLSGGGGEGSSNILFRVADEAGHGAGVMRVIGQLVGTGFGAYDRVGFEAGRIEVDANTALISLQSGTALGGELHFFTPRLHVAQASVLDQLANDPNFSGRALALQTPTTTARPEGVVRAEDIYVHLDGGYGLNPDSVGTQAITPYSVLVQNTGSLTTRAGFTAGYAEIFSPENAAPGAIDMVVNGQLVTPEGTLTGVKVRDALMEDEDPARFSADSTINGCGVSGGGCTTLKPPPPPTTYDPGPPVASQIVLFTEVPTQQQQFGNEEAIEDNQEDGGEDSASSPIDPPSPLFDTRPLASEDETDEPISGGGNPALFGASLTTEGGEGEDEEEDERKRREAAGNPQPAPATPQQEQK